MKSLIRHPLFFVFLPGNHRLDCHKNLCLLVFSDRPSLHFLIFFIFFDTLCMFMAVNDTLPMHPVFSSTFMASPTSFSPFSGTASSLGSRTLSTSSEPEPWSRHRLAQMHIFPTLLYVPFVVVDLKRLGRKLTVCSGILSSPQSPLYGNSPDSHMVYQQRYNWIFSVLLFPRKLSDVLNIL